ncbi:sulfoxide reductase heme-binding subunit YedZ [Limimaricola soesokkakensis]|uniref:Protein-methionine-sulfoxide reductase heme-binding subunit MsrQ n=1 Tax=Limimaricola soesokkakensis TaxID=1343159 RepID=A0A1X6YRX1_9RHOB|nr:protein-methionine-sulfoxide reductase heme-binding subunit MsrQ [Limimaricola soesokkakensis]PSK88173.1 sulfoxide reductase heme-binding subunit YedZ [Limimaricola soesokkakensis]SLN29102.1 Sulfoxide reductase heme-binding subunit YedZ [Limimaricola soesokkakensis]
MARPLTTAQRINGMLRRVPAWPLYVLGAIWAGFLFWQALTGRLGVEPINALEREYGDTALKLLVAGLAVTPLMKYTRVSLLKFRRAIGLLCFFFVLAHFSVWALLDVQSFGRVWADILKRPYVTVGMIAFLGLIPLALTSNNWSVRRLGRNWRRLHQLVYGIAILGAVHYIWLAKGFQIEPLVYLGLILGLLATRIRWKSLLQQGRAAA